MFSASQRQKTIASNHESKPLSSVSKQIASRQIEYLVCAMNCSGTLKYYGKWSTGESSSWIKQWQITKGADRAKVDQLKVTMKAFAAWKKAGKARGFGQRIGGRLYLAISEGGNFPLSLDHPIVQQFYSIIFNHKLVPPYYDHLLLFIFYLEAYIDAEVCGEDDKENVKESGDVGDTIKLPYDSSPQLLSILTDCLAMFSVDFWASKDVPEGELVTTFETMVMSETGGSGSGKKRGGVSESGGGKRMKLSAGKRQHTQSIQKKEKKTTGKETAEKTADSSGSGKTAQQSGQQSSSSGQPPRSALFTKCLKQGTMRTSAKASRKVFGSSHSSSQQYPPQLLFSYISSK